MLKIKYLLLLFTICFTGFYETFLKAVNVDNKQYSFTFNESIETLNKNHNFVFRDMKLSQEERLLFDKLEIQKHTWRNRFGNLELLKEELPGFIQYIGKNDKELANAITDIIFKIATRVKDAMQKETAWVWIGTETPQDLLGTPSWRIDEFWQNCFMHPIKFEMTLKGSPTLFCNLPSESRNLVIENKGDNKAQEQLIDRSQIASVPVGYGAFFIIGDSDNAAIYSEPKTPTERLFFHVLACDNKEIQTFRHKMMLEYGYLGDVKKAFKLQFKVYKTMFLAMKSYLIG